MDDAGLISQSAPQFQALSTSEAEQRVKHFRQIVLWPVNLMPFKGQSGIQDYWTHISAAPNNPWREVEDEFTGDPKEFQERHYNEFVAFLPPVQRFLYGQSLGQSVQRGYGESPIRVLRRSDIAQVRVTLSAHRPATVFEIAHVDLYLFFDVDVAMLAVELFADDLPLKVVQETMFQFGRAYPGYWEEDGRAGHCPLKVEWLSKQGDVLAVSDYENKEKYLTFACIHRAPCVAAHWEYLLQPLVLHQSSEQGPIRYRLLEYHRMPLMAYLALEKPDQLTRADNVRLALASGSGDSAKLPLAEGHYDKFKAQHCYDLYRDNPDGHDWSNTSYWTCGLSFVVTGDANNRFFVDPERGYVVRFRHQHFVMFMIAHFHRAALQMFSDRLAGAVSRLNIAEASAVQSFRRETRLALESFLRFTHRYWFEEISDQAQTKDLFALCRRHLAIDRLYEGIRQEVQDMSQYLENDATRRQNESVVRLTVVTTFGLIGTVATGFLGMNLFDLADQGMPTKIGLFALVFVPTALLCFYTINISRRLSDFLDALANENLTLTEKWRVFLRLGRRDKRSGPAG
jgi:hypothetical protein